MQIALPGSLHRVIMWLCTHSQLSTTVEAHDADRPAGLAAACHRVAEYSFTAVHRGTRCRSPCRARCIVSWCDGTLTHRVTAIHQSRHTMQIALPGSLHRVAGCSVPAVSHVRAICTCVRVPCLWCSDLSSADQPFFFEKAPTLHKHKVAHAAVRPGGLTARCVQSTPVCKSTITWCWYSTIWRSCGCQSSVARALAPGQTRQGSHSRCKKKKKSPNPMQSQAHAAARPGGLTAHCVQSTPVCKSTITWCWYSTTRRRSGCQSSVARAPGRTR